MSYNYVAHCSKSKGGVRRHSRGRWTEREDERRRERESELEKATLSFRAEVTVSMVTREYPALQLVKNGATEEEPVRSG